MVFDLSKPGAKAIRAPMGGGWIVRLTPEGEDVLTRFFDEPATPIGPLGGELGWIVEPQDSASLAEYLKNEGVAWIVE